MGKGIFPGSKFYRYEGDEPVIVRIVNVNYDKNIIKYINSDGMKWKSNLDDFKNSYRMLTPDASISFSIVDVNGEKDVIVAAKKIPKSIEAADKIDGLPTIVCRQMCSDVFVNMAHPEARVIGACVSQATCPAHIDFSLLLACSGLESSDMISTYLDDKLEDILRFVNVKKFNAVLSELYTKNHNLYDGLCMTIKQLLSDNKFMYDYRRMFDIMEIPFHIDEKSECLSSENVAFLSNELKVNIVETYVLKYTKDIDMSSITRSYVLVTSAYDGYKDVYIVGYDKE